MNAIYTHIPELSQKLKIPQDGILTQTLFQDEHLKVVLFGFSTGQELSAHTSPMPAILHFIEGEAEVILEKDKFDVKAGAWIHMTPKLPHSIRAKTPLIMLLELLKNY